MIFGNLQVLSFLFFTLVTDKLSSSFMVMACLVGAIRLPTVAVHHHRGLLATGLSVGILALGLYFLVMLVLVANVTSSLWVNSMGYVWGLRYREVRGA